MNLVTLDHVAKQYSERVLLDGVDLRVNAGERIGLIGVNGSGKTTLLRIVAGLESPDAGTATVWGGVRVVYLPQEPVLDLGGTVLDAVYAGDAPLLATLREHATVSRALAVDPDDMALHIRLDRAVAELDRTGGWAAEAEARAVLSRLGILDVDALVGTLSGGQQKRVALAKALVEPADLLVLDEPTNHVDAETIAWLEQYLLRTPRALLMVTHDRYFLDRVANRIVELDRRQLVSYPGSYTRYLELRAQRHEGLAKGEENRRRHLKRELEWLRRGAKARSTKQKARKERVAELQTIQYDSGEERVALALAGRRLGKQVLSATGLAHAYDGRPVLRGIDLTLTLGERIGIIGPNGAGKSTLLDILAGQLSPDEGRVEWGETVVVGYFDQRSAGLDDGMKVIDYIDQEAPLIKMADGERITSARMLEWLLFPGPQQHALIGSLSGGERRRLYLLRTLIHQPNVLLLDEPTNDLDIETLGVLEAFLDAFTGTLVVVSHDRYFLDRTVDQLAILEDGRLHAGYPTPFESFLRVRAEQRRQQAEAAGAASGEDSGARGSGDATAPVGARTGALRGGRDEPSYGSFQGRPLASPAAAARKLSWKEARELEALTATIEGLEGRKAALEAEVNGAGGDFARLQAAADAVAALEGELEATMARWLELGEIAEGTA